MGVSGRAMIEALIAGKRDPQVLAELARGRRGSSTRLLGAADPTNSSSRARPRVGRTGKGNPYLMGVLGEAAAAAAKTDTFLGARYRRLVKRRSKLKALVAVARSILTIFWHPPADPTARYHDLAADYHARRIDIERRTRSHIRQLEALGYKVTLAAAA
jgi:transposase